MRYADFHALRYTWATFLQRNGVPARQAMQLMRHSDLKLTMNVYTDESQLPIFQTLQSLPNLFERAHGRAQNSGADGQNGSQPVASKLNENLAKIPVNAGSSRVLSLSVVGGGLERAKGFEPSTFTLAR